MGILRGRRKKEKEERFYLYYYLKKVEVVSKEYSFMHAIFSDQNEAPPLPEYSW